MERTMLRKLRIMYSLFVCVVLMTSGMVASVTTTPRDSQSFPSSESSSSSFATAESQIIKTLPDTSPSLVLTKQQTHNFQSSITTILNSLQSSVSIPIKSTVKYGILRKTGPTSDFSTTFSSSLKPSKSLSHVTTTELEGPKSTIPLSLASSMTPSEPLNSFVRKKASNISLSPSTIVSSLIPSVSEPLNSFMAMSISNISLFPSTKVSSLIPSVQKLSNSFVRSKTSDILIFPSIKDYTSLLITTGKLESWSTRLQDRIESTTPLVYKIESQMTNIPLPLPSSLASFEMNASKSQTKITMLPENTEAWWGQWSTAVNCFNLNGQYVKLFQRTCQTTGLFRQRLKRNNTKFPSSLYPSSSPCVGNSTNTTPCNISKNSPFTESSTAKALGVLTLNKFTINNNTTESPDLLRLILSMEGSVKFHQLKTIFGESLLRLHKKSNQFVENIEIQEMRIGSLVINYVIVLNATNQTLQNLNLPENGNISFFGNNFNITSSNYEFQFSDYKECEGDVSSCDLHAHCYEFTDRLSFGCQCKEGFQGNGFKCQEIEDVIAVRKNKLPTEIAIVIVATIIVFVILVAAIVIFYGKIRSNAELKNQDPVLVRTQRDNSIEMESTFHDMSFREDEKLTK